MSEHIHIDCDVLVCGAGCAGTTAALAAARTGARTVVVERAGFAGGIITCGGLPFFDGVAHISDNRVIFRGIPWELYTSLSGTDPSATHVDQHNPTIPNVERFKILADELLTSLGDRMRVLYHTFAADVVTKGDRIDEVIVANKAGLVHIHPKVVVDCSGDADVSYHAGAPTEKKAELQPMTLHFRVGNVRRTDDMGPRCQEALIKAQERGDLLMFYGPGVSFKYGPNEVYIHAVRVSGDASDPDDLTRAEMQARRDSWAMYEAWKRDVPGFEDSYLLMNFPYIGVRETRRIVGQHVLTEDEIVEGKRFDDAIATGVWYLDQHPARTTLGTANAGTQIQPDPYDIPYRSLLPQRVSNLLVAGRCHSSTQLAASSTRVTFTAMSLGQAAGTAAALSVRDGVSPQELPPGTLQTRMIEDGCELPR